MGNVLFARPRHWYDSYQDLYRLIELSGFPLVYFDEIDPASDHTYILTAVNGENNGGWQTPRARIIHWNLEWDAYPAVSGVSETWASDKWFAEQIGARYVPMGSHPGLKLDTAVEYDVPYHAAFLGYMIPRRQQVWTWLVERGLRVTTNGAWGEQRHALLMQSTVYLHVHQHADKPGLPALRMVVAAAYSLPFITEEVADRGIFGYMHFMQSSYGAHFADFVRMWACDEDKRRLNDYGAALHDALCRDLTFRRSIEQAV